MAKRKSLEREAYTPDEPVVDPAKENAALRRQLAEALEQQAATSEVLQVISTSSGELEPVFETILANAVRICEATFGNMYLRDGEVFRIAAAHNTRLRGRQPPFQTAAGQEPSR